MGYQRIILVPANDDYQILDIEEATTVVYEEPLQGTLEDEEALYGVLECEEDL